MIPNVSIIEAMSHPELWARWFRNPATWAPWRVFLATLFGLPLDEAGLALYRQCTGRETPPPTGFNEAWLICGRRAGKSFVLALIACYLAVFRDWSGYLTPGESAAIKIVAVDRRQARVIFRYITALLAQVPALANLIARQGDEEIELVNGITIEVATASFRTLRGFTILGLLADEIAYWRNDETAANPDAEILTAARAAQATLDGRGFILTAGSPYARKGEQYRAYREHHGSDDSPVLVWKAPTRVMNPSVSEAFVAEQVARDPEAAAAEYMAEFRSDLADFLDRQLIESAIDAGVAVRPYRSVHSYTAAADPSGGRGDSFTAAISHREDDVVVLDALYERRPPFNPTEAVGEIAELLEAYNLSQIVGDKYAAEWVVEAFTKAGVAYTSSERNRSEIYLDALPLFTAGRVRLLDHPRLISQFTNLERRTSRIGRDVVDHPPGSHDDCCNSASLALVASADDQLAQWRRLVD